MGMKVSTRVQTSRQSKGQAGHDFDGRPEYADPTRKHLNKTIFGGTEKEINALIDEQSKSIKTRFNENADSKRFKCLTSKETKKIGSWRKTTATHKKAIITFCSEFRALDKKEKVDRDRLDKCAKKHFLDLCKNNGCQLTYIVRHDDEANVHYHAMFTNFNGATLKPLRFEMRHLSDLQDDVGSAFSSLGLERGTMRNIKLAQIREDNPQLENEDEDEYRKRTYKLANVTYRTVAQLHDEQEADFKAQHDANKMDYKAQISELANELNGFNNSLNKVRKNIATSESKLKSTNAEDVDVRNKIEKNLATYERRENKFLSKIAITESKLSDLNSAQANANAEIGLLKSQMLELQQKNSELSKSNGSLENKLQDNSEKLSHAIKQIVQLSKKELPEDISEPYQVKDGFMGHKEVQLITPEKYYKFAKPLQAHRLNNRGEQSRLEKLDAKLGRKETDLQKRVKNFENEVKAAVKTEIKSMSAQLKPELVREMVGNISAVASEVYRMKQKHNIHQGFGMAHSLSDKQEKELRVAMNSAVGREYIEGIVDYTKRAAIQEKIDSKLDSVINPSNDFTFR